MSEDQEEPEIEINWDEVKRIYLKGDDLRIVAIEQGTSVPEILLKAHTGAWGSRGSVSDSEETKEEIKPTDIISSHRDDLLQLRLTASMIRHKLDGLTDPFTKVKIMEKLANVYSKLIPMERVAHNIDTNTGEAPDRIVINVGGPAVVEEEDEE